MFNLGTLIRHCRFCTSEGRDLRRRRKRDYNRLNTIGGSESEDNQQQTNKEKTQPQKSKTQKMKLEEANKKISELLDTVTLLEQENKEGLQTNRALKNDIDIKVNVIKDMEKAIIDKSKK